MGVKLASSALSITVDKLFEYVIAAILRGSGYVAGVPIRRIGGRGTSHQIDVIGIELNHLPFLYDTILLVEAKCYSPNESVGIDVIRQVKSNVMDLEQTLPRELTLLPRNLSPIDYFTNILGKSAGEGWTVNYRGAVFTTGQYSQYAKEFAYAHGIFLFVFPPLIKGKPTVQWVDDLKKILSELSENQSKIRIYLPLIRNEETFKYYEQLLVKLREDYSSLKPEERHYLFTLIRGILERSEEMQPFWEEIEKIIVADFNGYPILAMLSHRISKQQTQEVLSGYLESSERKKGKNVFGSRLKISNIKLVKHWSEPLNKEAYVVSFGIKSPKVEGILEGRLFVPSELHALFGEKEVALSIPFIEGLSLVAYYS